MVWLVICKFQKDCAVYIQSVVTQTNDTHVLKGGEALQNY